MIHRGRPRRVVPAEAQSHDADALGVELGTACEIIVRRARMTLRFVMQREASKTDRLSIAGSIEYETRDAARREIRHAAEVLNLFGHVEAVEKQHDRPL